MKARPAREACASMPFPFEGASHPHNPRPGTAAGDSAKIASAAERAMNRKRVLIAGAGGMGSAVGLLLRELGSFEVDLFVGDSDERRAAAAAVWIREGSARPGEARD